MERLITVRTYNDYFAANSMLDVLKEEGIQAILLNQESGIMLPSLAVGGIKLQVRAEDEERAEKIIFGLEADLSNNEDAD